MPEDTNIDSLPEFTLPSLEDNQFGWGPSQPLALFEGIPFAPFNKNDRLGRISDWTQQGQNNRGGRGGRGRYPQQFGAGSGLFQYKHEDDESTFSLVDNRPKPKSRFARRRPITWNTRAKSTRFSYAHESFAYPLRSFIIVHPHFEPQSYFPFLEWRSAVPYAETRARTIVGASIRTGATTTDGATTIDRLISRTHLWR